MSDFATRLRELRHSQNLTQAQLAEKVGICQITISRYENGDKPLYAKAVFLARFFDVSIDYIMGITDDRLGH